MRIDLARLTGSNGEDHKCLERPEILNPNRLFRHSPAASPPSLLVEARSPRFAVILTPKRGQQLAGDPLQLRIGRAVPDLARPKRANGDRE